MALKKNPLTLYSGICGERLLYAAHPVPLSHADKIGLWNRASKEGSSSIRNICGERPSQSHEWLNDEYIVFGQF